MLKRDPRLLIIIVITYLRRAVGSKPLPSRGFAFSRDDFLRTFVYIDGLNLYYRALKGTAHKWLDLEKFCQSSLHTSNIILSIQYYTAPVSGKINVDAPKDQRIYFSALETLNSVTTHLGKFQVKKKDLRLATPLHFNPEPTSPVVPIPVTARVLAMEEKGTDVNLAVHLVRDAFLGKFDHAVIVTNDTDLMEPIRIVTQDLGLNVTLLTPVPNPAGSLTKYVTGVRHINETNLKNSQLAATITHGAKTIIKPADW